LGTFHEGHLSIWHAYLFIAIGCRIYQNPLRTKNFLKIYDR
jgi:hypothetical protein